MEDVDKIIIHSLRQIGCELDDEIRSIGQFTTEVVVEATARCLRSINPEIEAPLNMPQSMSVRFRIGATLAQACQDLGYKGDIGYQTFLYSTEADIRKVLMFLIELLPKESEKMPDVPLHKNYHFKQKIAKSLRHQLSKPWLPLKCRRKGVTMIADESPFVDSLTISGSKFDSVPLNIDRPINGQILSIQQLIPSILTLNSMESSTADQAQTQAFAKDWSTIFSLEKPALPPKPKFLKNAEEASATTEEQEVLETKEVKSEEVVLQELEQEVSNLLTQIENAQVELKEGKTKLSKAEGETDVLEKQLKIKNDKLSTERKVFKLLPEANENIKRLDELINEELKKLLSLGSKWDKRRAPLIDQYRELRQNTSHHLTESQLQAEIARSVEQKLKELTIEVKEKEQLQSRLKLEYEKLSKDISRSSYTRRIFEIIGNINKQKEDINKILADTRFIQKDINQLTGRLDRSFAVTDEMIFRDAKRDETARNAYKLLATLHSDCSKLVKLVEDTGSIMREIRDLEDQIETENAKNISANLERITADLLQMQKESAALQAQLKSLS